LLVVAASDADVYIFVMMGDDLDGELFAEITRDAIANDLDITTPRGFTEVPMGQEPNRLRLDAQARECDLTTSCHHMVASLHSEPRLSRIGRRLPPTKTFLTSHTEPSRTTGQSATRSTHHEHDVPHHRVRLQVRVPGVLPTEGRLHCRDHRCPRTPVEA